jgi:hypothetical protein
LSGRPRPDLRRALKWSENLDVLVNPTFAQMPGLLKTSFLDEAGVAADLDGHVYLSVAVEWTTDGEPFGWTEFYLNGMTRVCDWENLRLQQREQRTGFGTRYLEVLIGDDLPHALASLVTPWVERSASWVMRRTPLAAINIPPLSTIRSA